jgi:hypothetical protein
MPVETVTLVRLVGAVHPIAVDCARPDPRQVAVPDLIGVFGVNYIRRKRGIRGDGAGRYLAKALPLRFSNYDIAGFNDHAEVGFAQIRALIKDARKLALAEADLASMTENGRRPPTTEKRPRRRRAWRTPTITEADALTVAAEPECANLAKLEAVDERKRRLLAEIELENLARAARGDFRLTYILCPEPPSNYRVEKVFASADDRRCARF